MELVTLDQGTISKPDEDSGHKFGHLSYLGKVPTLKDEATLNEEILNRTLEGPLKITWEITNACNLRCIHCSNDSFWPYPDEMTTQEMLNVVDQIAEMKVFKVQFSGGEPMRRPDLYQIAKYAYDKKINLHMITNGTFITERTGPMILDAGIRKLSISIDGATEESHEYIRGRGTWRKSMEGLRILRELGADFIICTVATRTSKSELKECAKLARELGAYAFGISRFRPQGRGANVQSLLGLSKTDYADVKKTVAEIEAEYGSDFVLSEIPSDPIIPIKFRCPAALSLCDIFANGDVSPCSAIGVSGGNLRRQKLKDIWKNGVIFNYLRDPNNLKSPCTTCAHMKSCHGGWHCLAMFHNQDAMAIDPHCGYA